MNVLSLFDGISCGRIALERLNIPIEHYYAYEIDEYALKVSKNNYSDIEHKGDVFNADWDEYKNIDLLLGGSPCTWWSNARTRKDVERKPNGLGYQLFQQYVKALKTIKPKYFLYENNYSISQDIKNQITKDLGVEPIMINSALVSAQNRKRMYWTNIPNIEQPIDKHILISDVIPNAINGAAIRNQKQVDGSFKSKLNIRKDHKSNCLLSYMTERNCLVQMNDNTIRQFTCEEFEVLQTLPIGYTDYVNKLRRKKLIGLSWTIDIIVHILSNMDI